MNSQIILWSQVLDKKVLDLMPLFYNSICVKIAIFCTTIGSPLSFVLLIIAMSLSFWLHKKPYHMVQFALTISTGLISMYLIKYLVHRTRPVTGLIEASGYSFPSGHALISTLFCSLIIFSYKDHFKNKFLKFIFVTFFTLIAVLISSSRVYLSVHYLSDVIVGVLIGLLISSISVFVFESFFKQEDLV